MTKLDKQKHPFVGGWPFSVLVSRIQNPNGGLGITSTQTKNGSSVQNTRTGDSTQMVYAWRENGYVEVLAEYFSFEMPQPEPQTSGVVQNPKPGVQPPSRDWIM